MRAYSPGESPVDADLDLAAQPAAQRKAAFGVHHVDAVAKALDLGAANLVIGTDAAGLVQALASYVPRALFEGLEKELASARASAGQASAEAQARKEACEELECRIRALTCDFERAISERDEGLAAGASRVELEDARKRLERATAETAALRLEVDRTRSRSVDLEQQLAASTGGVEQLEFERDEALARAQRATAMFETRQLVLATEKSALAIEQSCSKRLQAEVACLRITLAKACQQVQVNYDAYLQADAQLQQARQQLGGAAGVAVATAFLTGVVGLGIGVAAGRQE